VTVYSGCPGKEAIKWVSVLSVYVVVKFICLLQRCFHQLQLGSLEFLVFVWIAFSKSMLINDDCFLEFMKFYLSHSLISSDILCTLFDITVPK